MQFTETIHGNVPSKSNCYRVGVIRGRHTIIKSAALDRYERNFYIQCKNRKAMITGYFSLTVKVFYPHQRADLDNSLKVILDCLQRAQVIANDNKCVEIHAAKFLDREDPRVELEITEA